MNTITDLQFMSKLLMGVILFYVIISILLLIYLTKNCNENISMARTPKVIAAQRALRIERKRLSSEVVMKNNEKKAKAFNMLLNLNQDLAKLKKK